MTVTLLQYGVESWYWFWCSYCSKLSLKGALLPSKFASLSDGLTSVSHEPFRISNKTRRKLVICGLETATVVKMSFFLSCRCSCFRVDPFYVFTNKTKPFLSFWPCSVNSNWTWYLQQATDHLWRPTRLCSRTFTVLLYVNDIHKSSDKLAFYLFADDTNLLCADKNLRTLELVVNLEFHKVYEWVTTYMLTLNVEKSNFIIFHPHQKKINYQLNLKILDNDPKTFLP